jgi:glycosyltransferase involved in cell wall biosynthesis
VHLLVLSSGFPFPLTTGRLRLFHFLGELARGHRITLLAAVPPGHPPEHTAVLAGVVDRVETVQSHRLSPRLALKLWSLVDDVLALTSARAPAELARRLHELHTSDPYDVVLNARLAVPVSRLLPGMPVVTDVCDTTSASLVGQLPHTPLVQRPKVLAKLFAARLEEATLARTSDHLLFSSERDRNALRGQLGGLPSSIVLPNGVDLRYWQRTTAVRPRDTVVFAGALPYPPNDDAARFLVTDVLPVIRRARPDVRLVIVGRDPSPRLIRTAAAIPGVELTGTVADMRPFLERATLALIPLRFGTGIQNKLLEAMAMGVPVVTTPLAAAGLHLPHDPSPPPLVAVAPDPDAFAAASIALLDAADADPSPDSEARRWVGERFRWDVVGDRLDAVLQSVTSDHR